jgi:signal transduction histidine kinase/DNA-binding response OmpR family regulator
MQLPSKVSAVRPVSLRTLLVVPFVLQIFAAVGLVGYLSFKNGQRAVNDLANQLMDKAAQQVDGHLDNYLALPIQLTEMNLDAIASGDLDLADPQRSERYFWRQTKAFPKITYIGYSLEDGSEAGAGRWVKGQDIVLYENLAKGKASDYLVNERGDRGEKLQSYDYDPVSQGWYQEAVKAGKLTWSAMEVAENFDVQVTEAGKTLQTDGDDLANSVEYYIAVSTAAPIYDQNRRLLGVTGTDLSLTSISDFLKTLRVSPRGQVFLMERDGQLIGSSSQHPILHKVKEELKRYTTIDSPDPIVRSVGQTLQQRFPSLKAIQSSQEFAVTIEGQKQFVQITPWRDALGLDWLVVVTVPESDFMGQINASTRTTIALCLLALLVACVLGLYTSRWLIEPIQRLGIASQSLAAGQLDHPVQTTSIKELGVLTEAFNQMAQQIRQAFTALETANSDLERRVADRTSELQEAKVAADAANYAKSEFLANMSHELRTPLNGILGYAQILQQAALNPKEQKGVGIIYQCATHLLTLINDVLDLSKIEARKLDLQPQDTHLPSLLQGVVEICRIKADQKRIQFVYEPDVTLPIGVKVDEKRLRQVLINLLGNAIKFTQKGKVKFQVKVLEITNSPDPQYTLRFSIADTGVGMTPEQLGKIFLPFEQVGDRHKQAEGTGLGLSISQTIVTLMSSHLEVESELGQGSRFWFEVTLPESKDWASANRHFQRGTVIGFEGAPRKILVVDDRWENRSVLVNFLEPLGFELAEANDGQEGLEQLKAFQPDLVITDLMMPVMDGFEFLNHLRQIPAFAELPVLVSSASVFASDQHRSLEAGGTAFLPKPVQVSELLDLFETHLQLTWVYQQKSDSPVPVATEETAIVPPSPEAIQQLHRLAMQGLLNDLLQELDRLDQSDPALLPFTQPLRQFAKRFQLKQIREFLNQYL